MESPLRGNTHGGFGERPGETDREQSRHRAPGRLNHPTPGSRRCGERRCRSEESHNHAQTARNLRRSIRNAAVGARLIQVEALDSNSAADLATAFSNALVELRQLERRLER